MYDDIQDPAQDQVAPATAPAQTLEDWGVSIAQSQGYDTAQPVVQQKIREAATQIRAQMPDTDDATIIAKAGPVIEKSLAASKQLPPGPGKQGFDIEGYKAAVQKMQTDFSPENEAKVRAQVKRNNLGAEIGRNLSLGYRIGAGAANQGILDKEYERAQAANNAPLEDWNSRKKAAISALEQQVKTGEIEATDVRNQLNRMGLEQALLERTNKQAIATAEADATSITSEAYRQMAKQYAPELVGQLGERFNTLTAAQLKATLPMLEKQYLKQLEIQQKKEALADKAEERKWKEGESQKDRDSRERAAAARRAGSGGGGVKPPSVANVIAGERLSATLGKEQRAVEDKAEGAGETIRLFDEVGGLLKKGLSTGPLVGGDNIVSKTYGYFSGNKQQADQITAQLASSMAKTFGAAPSDKETALIKEANTVMKLDNPGPALAALKAKFERLVAESQADAADIASQRARIQSTIGNAPAQAQPRAAGAPTISDKASYDALPKGSVYIDGRDGKQKRKG